MISIVRRAGPHSSILRRVARVARAGLKLLLVLQAGPLSAELTLVKEHQPSASIVIAKDALEPARAAANELREYIRKITGATLPIVSDDAEVSGSKVLVGESKFTRALGLKNADFARQEYLIRVAQDRLILMGRDESDDAAGQAPGRSWMSGTYFQAVGSFYAVDTFLEKYCGVRWYMPTEIGEVIPEQATLRVGDIDARRRPSTRHRSAFVYAGAFPTTLWQWGPKGPATGARLSAEEHLAWGRRLKMGGELFVCNHGQTAYPQRFEKAHPDWFAKGATLNQLCYSNPEVLAQVVQDARDFFESGKLTPPNQMPMAAGNYFSVMPVDGANWCDCEACWQKLGERHPNQPFDDGYASEYVWDFVARVAKEVAKTHPDKFIGCCSYWDYNRPPKNVEIPPNVAVMICKAHSFTWMPKFLKEQRERLEAWRKKGVRNLFFWDYYLFPESPGYEAFPSIAPHAIARDIMAMKAAGADGGQMCQMAEDLNNFHNLAVEHLRLYVTMKLLDDWDQDVDALLAEYYRLFYGLAEKPMRTFFERIEQTYFDPRKSAPFVDELYPEDAWTKLCPPNELAGYGDLIKQARELTMEGSIYRRRVELIETGLYQAAMVGPSETVRARMLHVQRLDVPRRPAPKLSGKLDDPVWQTAAVADHWSSLEGGPLQRPTRALVLFDDKNLYVGFECLDDPTYPADSKISQHDAAVYSEDSVEIFIDVGRKMKDYYQLAANTMGTIYDSHRTDASWESGARVICDRKPGRWTMEWSIPLAALGVTKVNPGEKWGINFCRNRRGLPGFVSPYMNWSGPSGYHNPRRFGEAIMGGAPQLLGHPFSKGDVEKDPAWKVEQGEVEVISGNEIELNETSLIGSFTENRNGLEVRCAFQKQRNPRDGGGTMRLTLMDTEGNTATLMLTAGLDYFGSIEGHKSGFGFLTQFDGKPLDRAGQAGLCVKHDGEPHALVFRWTAGDGTFYATCDGEVILNLDDIQFRGFNRLRISASKSVNPWILRDISLTGTEK